MNETKHRQSKPVGNKDTNMKSHAHFSKIKANIDQDAFNRDLRLEKPLNVVLNLRYENNKLSVQPEQSSLMVYDGGIDRDLIKGHLEYLKYEQKELEQFYINENKKYEMRPIDELDGMLYYYWKENKPNLKISKEEE